MDDVQIVTEKESVVISFKDYVKLLDLKNEISKIIKESEIVSNCGYIIHNANMSVGAKFTTIVIEMVKFE